MRNEIYQKKKLEDMKQNSSCPILKLKGQINSKAYNRIINIDGIYELEEWNQGIFRCYDINGRGNFEATRRELLPIVQEVIRAKNPARWHKTLIYWDSEQDHDTFEGTLLYIVIMVLLLFTNDRLGLWSIATYIYVSWKSKKFN